MSQEPEKNMNKTALRYAIYISVFTFLAPTFLFSSETTQAKYEKQSIDEAHHDIDYSFFIFSGLEKLSQRYPWLPSYYPSYKEDIRDSLMKENKLHEVLSNLRKENPEGKIELHLKRYLENKNAEKLFLASLAISASFISGNLAGSISPTNFDDSSVFQLSVNGDKYTSLIHKSEKTVIPVLESTEKDKAIIEKAYEGVKESFIEDAILAIGLLELEKKKASQQKKTNE